MYSAIREICQNNSIEQHQFDQLMKTAGLSRDPGLDYICGIFDEEEELLAGAGCCKNTVRCLAVRKDQQGEGLLRQLMGHLMQIQFQRGNSHIFLYTKPEAAKRIETLGFYEIARTGDAVFLENERYGFENYCNSLTKLSGKRIAAVVMNANPITLGHLHLVKCAAEENDWVHVFLLSEEAGPIPAQIRWDLACHVLQTLPNVVCHPSGSYLISSATFPSYFLKDSDQAIQAQAELDLKIFEKLAACLGIQRRYAGQEPFSHVTERYNQIMAEKLPKAGLEFHEIPRLEIQGQIVSASSVRQAIHDCRLPEVRQFLPESVYEFFESESGREICSRIRDDKEVRHY